MKINDTSEKLLKEMLKRIKKKPIDYIVIRELLSFKTMLLDRLQVMKDCKYDEINKTYAIMKVMTMIIQIDRLVNRESNNND